RRACSDKQTGGNWSFLLPEGGSGLLPQSIFILARAPPPNAAKLWVDFILSEQGQTILVKGEALVSGRSGFKSPLPEYAPAIDSLNLVNVDWQALSTDKLKVLRDEWTSVFNP